MPKNRQVVWSDLPRSRTGLDWIVATLAMLAIAAHDAVHLSAGRYWDVFWVCNLAALLVGPAVLLRSPLLAAAALTWLVPGTVVWLSDALIAGSNILPTSYAIHLGGTAAALYATRRAGYARRGWVAALGLLVAAVAIAHFALPASTNVNAAHALPRGWGFKSRTAFDVGAVGLSLIVCALGNVLSRAVAVRRHSETQLS